MESAYLDILESKGKQILDIQDVNCSVLADTHSRPNLRNPRAAGGWCKATDDESLNPSCWANEVSYETDSNSINRTDRKSVV